MCQNLNCGNDANICETVDLETEGEYARVDIRELVTDE